MVAAAGGSAHWSSRFAFVMASVGFAVGLGNIWRFPYVTGENGGSAFVLIYLLCAFGIGVPCLVSELIIGRRGQHSPPRSMAQVAEESGRSRRWSIVGGMGVFTAFAIAVTYAVVVGWVLWYLYRAVMTGFSGITPDTASQAFNAILNDSTGMLFWTIIGNLLVGTIIFAGVKGGIERAVNVMMPLMFTLLIGLGIYNAFTGGFMATLEWLFTPDFSKVGPETLLAAIGQAFFSIGVGMGGMMTYGSYLPKSFSITRGAAVVVIQGKESPNVHVVLKSCPLNKLAGCAIEREQEDRVVRPNKRIRSHKDDAICASRRSETEAFRDDFLERGII